LPLGLGRHVRTSRGSPQHQTRRDRRCARVVSWKPLPSGKPREPYARVNWPKTTNMLTKGLSNNPSAPPPPPPFTEIQQPTPQLNSSFDSRATRVLLLASLASKPFGFELN
jgi:hypothetical protein